MATDIMPDAERSTPWPFCHNSPSVIEGPVRALQASRPVHATVEEADRRLTVLRAPAAALRVMMVVTVVMVMTVAMIVPVAMLMVVMVVMMDALHWAAAARVLAEQQRLDRDRHRV